jgi:hypothetical protein
MSDRLARYVVTHPRARAAFDATTRLIIRSQPYLPGLGWFLAVFYGCFVALFALGGWWPGVAMFAGCGSVSWWCVRGIRAAARDLERLAGELERPTGGEPS